MANVRVPPFDTAPETVVGATPQSVFAFEFPFWSTADILVLVDDVQLASSAYAVEGVFVQNGGAVEGGYGSGTVTLNTPVSNVTVTIDRFVVGDRESQFSRTSPLPMPVLNSDLNKLTARQQDITRRSLIVPPGSSVSPQDVIDAAQAVAGKADRALGNATVVSPLFPLAAPVPVLNILTSTLRVSLLGTPGPNNDYSALVSAAAPLLQFRTLVIDVPEIRLDVVITGKTNIHITGDGESQRTIRVFGGGVRFVDCSACEIDNVAILPATGYDGPGLDWTGPSSNNDVHDVFIQGFTQEGCRFVGTMGAGNEQSGNKLRNCEIKDCGDATHASYVFEWSQDSETTAVQCGSAVKGINQYNGRYTLCRQGLIDGGKNWNAKVAVFFDRCGKFKVTGARFEESQFEVAKFFQCDRINIGETHFHTASEAATGASDCVLLDGCARITFDDTAVDSFNAVNSRHAFNAINGCTDLKLVGCSSENYSGKAVNGSGWTVIGHTPNTANTATLQEYPLQAEAVAAGVAVFATPTGKKAGVGDAGLRFAVDTVVTQFTMTTGAQPGASESYDYELLANNVAIASGTISAGQTILDVAGAFAVPARQLLNARITPSAGAAVTSHIGSLTVAR